MCIGTDMPNTVIQWDFVMNHSNVFDKGSVEFTGPINIK